MTRGQAIIDMLMDATRLAAKFRSYPPRLVTALVQVAAARSLDCYIIGGTVRDWLLDRTPGDLDLTVPVNAVACCRSLIAQLGGGTFVPLGCSDEDAGRVVWQGLTIDFSSFRLGAPTIEADLCLRDYTVNAMGVALLSLIEAGPTVPRVIDPLGGLHDLTQKILRACPDAFGADPLRMLRGYRLSATLGFHLEEATKREIGQHVDLISLVSVERISHELDLIMASDRAHAVMAEMAASGLLWQVIPELARGVGMAQPVSHHLDVFAHSLAALGCMEEIMAAPERFYPEYAAGMQEYMAQPGMKIRLKWAALLHDVGKPVTMAVRDDQDGRITFYGHDQTGKKLALKLGRGLKWSNAMREGVAALIGMHMQPFHLCNVRRKKPLSRKACLNLCRKAGDDLLGLFLLAMADSLAGKGEEKPPAMEIELSGLLMEILTIYEEHIQPALTGPRLLTGQDLITAFALHPGPLFAKILHDLELAQIEGKVLSRQDAHRWVQQYLEMTEVNNEI